MLKNYLKTAFRHLRKHKAHSLINLVGLAIGMTCFILILLWIRDELSYDRFHENVDHIYRVVRMDPQDATAGVVRAGAPWGPALKQDFPEVQNFVRLRGYGRTLVSADDKQFFESEGFYADSTIFDIFTFPVVAGNPQKALTQPNSIVVTEEMASKYFGGSDGLGQTLIFNNRSEFQITAIVENVPSNSHFKFDFLVPFSMYAEWDLNEWNINNFYTYLLLSPAANVTELEGKIPDFLRRHADERTASGRVVKLQPLTDIHLYSNLHRELEANGDIAYVRLFSVVAVFILLIACMNFVNLTTARSATRAKEVGIRKVVGSDRRVLIRQFLGESVLASFLALVAAIGLVELLLPYFNVLSGKSLTFEVADNLLFGFGLIGLALCVGLLSGVYPAFVLSSFRPVSVIKSHLGGGSRAASTLKKTLVVIQFAISIVLVIGTLVVYRQMHFISNAKLGFDKEHVLVVRTGESALQNRHAVFRNKLLENSNIANASASSNLFGGSDWGMPFKFEGATEGQTFSARTLVVDERFLQTHDVGIVAGRNFSNNYANDVSKAYLINETAARLLGWENPLGKSFGRPLERNEQNQWDYEDGHVIGVVNDFHFRSLHSEIQPMVIFMKPEWFNYLSVKIREGNVAETVDWIERQWREFEPSRPFDYFFLDEIFDEMYRAERRFGKIFTVFSVLAITIACLGLFGLASFAASQRTKEIGIRKVLGASIGRILFLLSTDFCKWILAANVIAWPLAFYVVDRWLQNFAYRVDIGWWVFAAAGGVALVIALLTVSTQAVKAALTNPVESLRYE